MSQATIEIGHTYAPELLLAQANIGINWEFDDTSYAQKLRSVAENISQDAVRVAFIDDVILRDKQKHSEDSWRWQLFISRSEASVKAGTSAEIIAFESSFIDRGKQLVEEIQSMELPEGYRMSGDGTKVVFGTGRNRERIPLVGFKSIDDPTHPSCSILDLAWLEHRLMIAPKAITLLPKEYKEQQRKVALLADLFPHLGSQKMTSLFIDQFI